MTGDLLSLVDVGFLSLTTQAVTRKLSISRNENKMQRMVQLSDHLQTGPVAWPDYIVIIALPAI